MLEFRNDSKGDFDLGFRVEAVDGATVVAIQTDPNIFFHCRPVDGATVMATKLVVE